MQRFRQTPRDGKIYQGASVTIPHKEAVIPFLDSVTEDAKTIGAVNTLYRNGGKILGHNTDMEGFIAPLRSRAAFPHAVLFGAGGAARAVLAALALLGVSSITIAARNSKKAELLISSFTAKFTSLAVTDWDSRAKAVAASAPVLVVNTTPLGMRGKAEGQSPVPESAFSNADFPGECLAYDIVYNPLKTAFLANAQAAGWQTVDGLSMFVGQAAAQFRLWTGKEMDTAWAHGLLSTKFASESGGR
jgi:shikimate dehydrogenase